MIARTWHGRTKASDSETYLAYLQRTGIPDYRATPGNLGAWILRRIEGDVCHFSTLTFWESFDAIRLFAGDNLEAARYYSEDHKYLLEFEPRVAHYEVFSE